MASPHKPRRRKKAPTPESSSSNREIATTPSKLAPLSPPFPLAAFLGPAKKSTSQWAILPLVLIAVGIFRWSTGFWGYSGFNVPPMYGDFEAQRHWMEITSHLPISQWYFHDLQYWGLDYPPLTAYHSWLLGKIGSLFDGRWFALGTSRGIEDQLLKVYMRATAIVSEYLVYIPAAVILNRKLGRFRGVSSWDSSIALVAILMQPATILIDHAHFQYNTVMLGFTLASISSMIARRHLWGCVFFVAALCYKQMALYYAPAVAFYLIGTCLLPHFDLSRFVALAVTTLLSFAICFAPLLLGAIYDRSRGIEPIPGLGQLPDLPFLSSLPITVSKSAWYYPPLLQLAQSIHRIFPFARGIFEDKVANLWCAVHTLHKLNKYPILQMQRISTMVTIISILPATMTISLFPRGELLPWAMASTSWGFYLCSFQVHEKTVLLPLLPLTILLGGDGGLSIESRAWVGWTNMLGVWTLFPLLKRDELRMPYVILSLLWAWLLGLPPTSLSLYFGSQPQKNGLSPLVKALHLAFYAVMLIWHVLEALIDTPREKPDLWVVLNVLVGFAGFSVCFLWCTWQLILRSGMMEDYFGFRIRVEAKQQKPKKKRR